MIGELVLLYLGWKVYRSVEDDPGYQLRRAREVVRRKQQDEIGSSHMNCHERKAARVATLQARVQAANAVEVAVRDLHEKSYDGLRKMEGTRTSINQRQKQSKG
jgi:hypothetical protein